MGGNCYDLERWNIIILTNGEDEKDRLYKLEII